jgi:hypothetical protein
MTNIKFTIEIQKLKLKIQKYNSKLKSLLPNLT